MTEDMVAEQETLFCNQDNEAIRHHMSKTLYSDIQVRA